MQQDKENRKIENKTTTPLISVIVPIFNVEKYVRKCLDSLRGQTLREIEVICINDGSTDGSGRIADEYESQDWPRFRVFHTNNKGLSAARNRGIDEANASWIMFVDSDDWVDRDFCRIPYEAAIRENADLVCFRAYKVTRRGRVKKAQKTEAPIGIVDEMMAHEFCGYAVWNKLYKRSLFSEIRFPEGHVHEDLATAHRFVSKAKKTVLIHDCLYYYFAYRSDSICNTNRISNKRDEIVYALDRYDFLVEKGYPTEKIVWLLQKNAIRYLSSIQSSQDEIYSRACEIVDNIKGIPKRFTAKQKIALIAWKIDRKKFYLICRMSGRLRE